MNTIQPSPQYIHFRNDWQILGPDIRRNGPQRSDFYDLMQKLNSDPINADFDDFSFRGSRCEMGQLKGKRQQDGGDIFTKLIYDREHLKYVEEWTETNTEEYKNKFIQILQAWFDCFPNTVIIVQKTCLRALLNPENYKDSREFIGNQILKLRTSLTKAFQQMPFKVGFTIGCVKDIKENKLIIDTTVNSWRDNRSVWVEVYGTSPMEKPINVTNCEIAGEQFIVCKNFFESEVYALLKEFDKENQ